MFNQIFLTIRDQLNLFWLALGFFSRIPMPKSVDYSAQKLNQSSRYFMLVGWLLGAIVASVYLITATILSVQISIWVAMIASLFLTGCFHEDGLADMADGFGGGFTTARKLEIMKDSRLGTYGVTSLVMILLGKFLLLNELFKQIILQTDMQIHAFTPVNISAELTLASIIMLAYALSRGVAASFIYDMLYVADETSSKSKPLANKQNKQDLFILFTTALPVLWIVGFINLLCLLVFLSIFRVLFKRYLLKHIGGYTGDCLGAAQQLSEIGIYISLLVLIQFPSV